MSRPVKRALTHRFSRPLVQYRHSPSVQPSQGTPDAPAVVGLADDLMAEDHRQLRRLDLAVAQVQIGPAHGTRRDLQPQLAGAGLGVGDGGGSQRLAGRVEQDRLHGLTIVRHPLA